MPEMKAFYQESITLPSVTTDSVNRFSVKVNDFIEVNPEALDDPLYPKIMSNIKTATLRITITINDEWDGETHINF